MRTESEWTQIIILTFLATCLINIFISASIILMKIVPSEIPFFSISPGENKLLELVRTFLFQKHPVSSNMTSVSEYEVAPRSFTQSFWRMSLSTNSTKLFSSCGIWVRSPFHPPLKLLCFNHSSFFGGKRNCLYSSLLFLSVMKLCIFSSTFLSGL